MGYCGLGPNQSVLARIPPLRVLSNEVGLVPLILHRLGGGRLLVPTMPGRFVAQNPP